MKPTERTERITPFYVMELLEKAKAMEARGEDIVHMEVGEPDFPTPDRIKEKAIEAIKENHTFYTHSLGIPELRERIAEYYRTTEGISIDKDRIIITSGTSGAFLLLFSVLLDSTRSLGVSDPGYPCYKNAGILVDGEVIPIPVTEETRFEITEEHLKKLKKIPDVLIVSTPSNPTGIVYREENLRKLCEFMLNEGKILVVDELYNGLIYGKRARSALSITDEVIVINGFSKTHAMTGWRLGWMVVPENLIRPIHKISQNVYISPPSIAQYAALAAFDVGDDLEGMKRTYASRRDFLLPHLQEMGFYIPVVPEGAFYIYADISKWNMDSMVFVERALNEAKVAITPGYDFGRFRAETHIRFSYANKMEMLKKGCERLKIWLGTL
ncbi:MAG: pyridoxal phosphate-dependent aminotransferase [Syntrophorhabdaceae bacterium]|nr:pyridoxal phosphate-dependent aminotransferase [Syntrophorhabdaceae bacterium]